MNPLLVDLSPEELQAVAAVRRRLQDRLERLRRSVDELGETRPSLEKWLEYPQAPVELGEGAADSWGALRNSLIAERDALARTQEEQRRAAAITREAVALLSSFLDLVSSGLEQPTVNGSAPAKPGAQPVAGPPPARSSSRLQPAEVTPSSAEPAALAEWRTLARVSLKESGPLHYREIYSRLRTHGVFFGGAHPAGTFLATINRDAAFVRVGRGVYWVAGEPLPEAAVTKPGSGTRTRRARA